MDRHQTHLQVRQLNEGKSKHIPLKFLFVIKLSPLGNQNIYIFVPYLVTRSQNRFISFVKMGEKGATPKNLPFVDLKRWNPPYPQFQNTHIHPTSPKPTNAQSVLVPAPS